MGRIYTVTLAPTAIAVTTTDLVAVLAGTQVPIGIRSMRIGQTSDFGDAQDEVVQMKLVRGNTTAGSGGSTFTPLLKNGKSAAVSFTARVGDTTAASAGTAVTPFNCWFNVRAGYDMTYTDDQMVKSDNTTGYIVLRFVAAPVDSLTIGAELDVEELY